jgi:hypothetical protein
VVFLLDPVKINHTKVVQQQSMWYQGTHYFVQIDKIIMQTTVCNQATDVDKHTYT